MTREEAIEVLSATSVTPNMHPDNMKLWDDALGLAIDALRMVSDGFGDYVDKVWKAAYERDRAEAQPDSERGYWIIHFYECFPAESTIECSQCHEEQPFGTDRNYCPSCGAKMEGTDNGS